ncbi:sugar ABC transporter substrate-binding protein [Devosia pacifica]|uniref:Sugar ABC transporter substrate-binding protein n=1 Tax=Devosia pacifica TaxID=1335967 RepID=A0A918VWG2_9HYPH|nr:extracellular solute-binding protein [Devosia pacifica]GHA29917.1 sugar ABC transporter substrate-binding protein [Devosia pacifica]
MRGTLSVLLAATALSAAMPAIAQDTEITEPVSVDDVAALGDVTLRVWADAGEETMLEKLIPQFEETYPNVTVDLTLKGWGDLMGTVVNAMNSSTPPDVTNGNQGFAIMGTMVRADLVRPLDDFIDAYDIDEGLPASGFSSMQWNDEGTAWGEGDTYAMGGATQPLGLFYNKSKLEELGLEAPDSIGDLNEALAAAEEAGEQPIMLGNSEQYPLGSHVLGILIDMYSGVDEINGWIAGQEGATFDTEGVRQALETLESWGEAGYFGRGYDGMSMDDAVASYGEGEGVFFLGGSFNGARLAAVDPDAFGFTLLRGESGDYVTTGTFGTPWLVSSKTEIEPAALAFLGMMLSEDFAQAYADVSRLPNKGLDSVTPTGSMHEDQLAAAERLFEEGDFVGYLDWATPTMQRTMGTQAQMLLAGRTDVDSFIEAVQSDWEAYQAERAEQ